MKHFLSLGIICLLGCGCLCEQPYVVQNEALEPFKGLEKSCVDFGNLKLIKRERFLNGTIQFIDEMDADTYKFQVELFSSPNGDGNFKRLPMGVPMSSLCDGMKGLYTQIVQPSLINGENTNFPFVPDEGLCPVPAGEYYVENIDFNTESWPNQIPRGILKALVTFYKNNVSCGGTVLKMKIEDRQ